MRRTPTGRRMHWDSWLLVGVAIICTSSLMGISDRHQAAVSSPPTTIPGLTGAALEKQMQSLDPGAPIDVRISSGSRSAYVSIGSGPTRGSVFGDSRLSDGAVESVTCVVDSTRDRPLTVEGSPILRLCATLPVSGGGADTPAWLQEQFDTAAVGYTHSENHNGAHYDLGFSQLDNTTTSYEITINPTRSY